MDIEQTNTRLFKSYLFPWRCSAFPGYKKTTDLNPLGDNGFSHPYHFDESTFVLRGFESMFSFLFPFSDENHISKPNSPRWDAAIRGVTSGAILFAYVPLKGRQAYMG